MDNNGIQQLSSLMAARTCLSDCLGADVLPSVLQHLQVSAYRHSSPSSLSALSLVSKATRAETEPFLYTTLAWGWSKDWIRSLALVLRTLLCRPELASHVHSVMLYGATREESCGPSLAEILNDGRSLELAIQAIDAAAVHYADRWKQQMRDGSMDAFAALLMSQLHNIRRFVVFDHFFTKHSALLGELFYSACFEPRHQGLSTFRQIQEIAFPFSSPPSRILNDTKTADALPLFYLPQIQSIQAVPNNPMTFKWPAQIPNAQFLTFLRLTCIRETTLIHLLSVTPKLETLIWDWYYNPEFRHELNLPVVCLGQIVNALSPVRNTLQKLVISAKCDQGRGDADLPVLEITGHLDLTEFCRLERLDIPLPFLATFDRSDAFRLGLVLPKHLQTLTINDDLYSYWDSDPEYRPDHMADRDVWADRSLLHVIELWLRTWRDSQPDLLTLKLDLKNTEEEWDQPMKSELFRLASLWGVKAHIHKISDHV